MSPFYRATAIGTIVTMVWLGSSISVFGRQNNPNPANADQGGQISWVLFNSGNPRSPRVSGDSTDEAAARQVLQSIGEKPMIWFKLDGRNYVSQDRAVMDRINGLDLSRKSYSFQLEQAERTRKENADYAASMSPSVIQTNSAEFRQLTEDVRQMALQPVTSSQDITALRKRVSAMVDTLMQTQRQVLNRDAAIVRLESNERELRRAGTEREILSNAIAAGKAQPAP